jgi:TonB family protein
MNASNQSSPSSVASNKPAAATSDASKQTAAPASNNSGAPLVKASAPVTDKPAASTNEQTKNSSAEKSKEQPVASNVSGEQASKPMMRPLLRPVSGGVLNGKAVSLPKPAYPQAAKAARMSGLVIVEVVIDGTGKVISARALSGPVLLQQAAVAAAHQAKFSPTILSGQPVKVVGTITYNFALN